MLPRTSHIVSKSTAGWWPRLWNAPNSLLGLVAGLGGKVYWDRSECFWEVTGGWLIRQLSRCGWADAITLGDVVIYADPAMRVALRSHELVHVRQGRVWGPLFLPAYLAESLFQWLRTGDGYRSNRFEVTAYGNSHIK